MGNRAYEVPGQKVAFKSTNDLSTKRYIGVKLDSNAQVIAAVAGDRIIGVMQQPAGAGELTTVMLDGISFGTAGAPISIGALVAMDANGKFITATTKVFVSKDTVDITMPAVNVVGIALTEAGADNELFAVKIL
jgi:hypothetical protein